MHPIGLLLLIPTLIGAHVRCETILRRELERAFPSARFGMEMRPPFTLSVESARGFPFMVHGPAGTTDLLARIRDQLDDAWQAEIVDAGWPAPPADSGGPDDRFDVYLDPSLEVDTAYTQGDTDIPETPEDDQTSFIALATM